MIDNEGKKQLKSINRQELELKKMKDQKEQLRKKIEKEK